MKDPIRQAVSLRCRTDRAIERLNQACRHFERGQLSPGELIEEASSAANRAGNLEWASPNTDLERSVNRKVAEYRRLAQTTAALALGCKNAKQARAKTLESARLALTLRDRRSARLAHELLWATSGGLLTEEEWAAFEACEIL